MELLHTLVFQTLDYISNKNKKYVLLLLTSNFRLFCWIGLWHAICVYLNRRDKQGSSSDGNQEKAHSGNEGDDCEVCKWALKFVTLNTT